MKKVYTKVIHETVAVMDPATTEFNALIAWLLQDDIDIVGAELAVGCYMPNENDGFASLRAELSQAGLMDKDGAILEAMASEWWNTAPPGVSQTNAHAVLSLPEGYAIPIKEEGYLYLNCLAAGKSSGQTLWHVKGIVYYTKGNPRRK
ncbi:hypothetical protein ES705_51048 [subsurface metagenome]